MPRHGSTFHKILPSHTSTLILNNRINPLQGFTSQQRYHTQLFQSSVIVTAKIIAFNIEHSVPQDQLNLLFNNTRNMGGAASVKAGEDIANTIARAHPMFPEVNDPKVTSMFMNYTKKEGLKRIFCAEPGQERFSKILGHDLRSHVSHAHLLVKLTKNTTSTQHLPTSANISDMTTPFLLHRATTLPNSLVK